MGMRKFKRSIARARMNKEGVCRMNKPCFTRDMTTGLIARVQSRFAENWRKYC